MKYTFFSADCVKIIIHLKYVRSVVMIEQKSIRKKNTDSWNNSI